MWILDSTGDVLNGKRVWLRPGKKYLFGRENVLHAIPSKTVSRHHMTIEVSPVKDRDGTRTHARTKVTVTDLNSSKGTTVDDKQIKGQQHVLEGTEHSITIGKYSHAFRIKWEPVVLSFSFSSKEMRADDPLGEVRSRLENLDIKTIIPYLVDQTTHVVQNKRNTAKGLQALINGKFIVQYSYIDALVYATTPSSLESEESLCPLETDYDSAWPDATEHLPPAGNEPVSRPAVAFAPNPSRIHVFDGYTFVFGDATQFENLQAAINNGQGKALFYEIKNGQTTATEIVQFIRKAAGRKGMGNGRQGSGGVVLVRFRSKGEYEPWSIELGNEVALMTDQRVIEQREFLDAILGNDASPLCRPLPREDGISQASSSPPAPAPEPQHTGALSQVQSPPVAQENRSSSRTKAPRVRSFVSKMKAFDDGFDMESIPVYTPEDDVTTDTQAMDVEPPLPPQHSQPLAKVEEEVEEEVVADLLPGARAMKRRRAEMNESHRSRSAFHAEPEAAPKPKRAKLDVLEEVRKHREEEEQHWKAEQDHRPSQDVNVEDLKNLAIVEEMEVPVRNISTQGEEISDRWDDKWNGRKNFKRFRRKGEPRHARQRVQSVIVPLEEVTRKNFGIGENYWVSSRKSSERGQASHPDDALATSHEDQAPSRSEASVPPVSATTLDSTPDPRPTFTRHRSQKRPRETRDSDSDEEPRFRFRRKR